MRHRHRVSRGEQKRRGVDGRQPSQDLDLSDPAKPVYIRDFGMVGTQPGATGSEGGEGIHGPISAGPQKNRVYIAYGTGNEGMIAIVDRKKLLTEFKNPLRPTPEELLAPQIGYLHMSPDQGAHTTFPIFDVPIPGFQGHQALRERDLLLVVSEAARADNCGQNYPSSQLTQGRPAPHLAFLLDISHEPTPWPLSTFRVQETQGDYCGRGGRFGAHSSAESFYAPYYGKIAGSGVVQRGRAHLGYSRSVCHSRGRLFRSAGEPEHGSDVRERRDERGRRVRHRDGHQQVQEGGRRRTTWRSTIAV